MSEFKAGFAHILGRANVGKSTFINQIIGKKLTVTSDKPQTTRNRIRCIYNSDRAQVVFLDTPGLHKPVDKLGKKLLHEAQKGLKGSDLLVYMVEPWGNISDYDRQLLRKCRSVDSPKILLVNKIDDYPKGKVAETLDAYGEQEIFDEYIPISALLGTNMELALEEIIDYLPTGQPLFPEDEETDRPTEFVISEYVREKVYRLTYEEVPYAVAVETTALQEREDEDLLEIYVKIYVARDSQKGILIGKNGSMIKKIGEEARKDIEKLLGTKVYLDLKVSVKKKWNKKEEQLDSFTG